MTEANLIKLHKHFSFLASGQFTERNFDSELEAEEAENSGRHIQGKMTPERRQLIIGDAKRHLESLEKKHPFLIPKEEPEVKEEVVEKEEKKTKSKGKK